MVHHIGEENIPWLKDGILQSIIDNWSDYLNEGQGKNQVELFKKHECTGRPLGNKTFIETLEKKLGISLKKKKPGPKKRGGN